MPHIPIKNLCWITFRMNSSLPSVRLPYHIISFWPFFFLSISSCIWTGTTGALFFVLRRVRPPERGANHAIRRIGVALRQAAEGLPPLPRRQGFSLPGPRKLKQSSSVQPRSSTMASFPSINSLNLFSMITTSSSRMVISNFSHFYHFPSRTGFVLMLLYSPPYRLWSAIFMDLHRCVVGTIRTRCTTCMLILNKLLSTPGHVCIRGILRPSFNPGSGR